MIREEKEISPEEINEKLLKELRTTGIVNDGEKVISLLDRSFTDKSLLVPVERKKDGSFSASSSVIAKEDYETVSAFVNHKIRQFGREILSGNIEINPCDMGTGTSCTYCAYLDVCGYDEKIPGYETRILKKLEEDEVMLKMRKEINGELSGEAQKEQKEKNGAKEA